MIYAALDWGDRRVESGSGLVGAALLWIALSQLALAPTLVSAALLRHVDGRRVWATGTGLIAVACPMDVWNCTWSGSFANAQVHLAAGEGVNR